MTVVVTKRVAPQVPLNAVLVVTVAAMTSLPQPARSHEVDLAAQQRMAEGSWVDYLWTGAEHMLTGYDHLLFLLGVVLFLRNLRGIIAFVTAFTVAHTLVLLGATPLRVAADHHLVDAFIGLTVAYKGFENIGGFPRLLGVAAPPLLGMVFIFGLIHGLGLSTQLQTLTLADDPRLVAKILWFNAGVELGQIAALLVMVPVINAWRQTIVWDALARIINLLLIFCGMLLVLLQLHGFVHARETGGTIQAGGGWHRHGEGPLHRHDSVPTTPAEGTSASSRSPHSDSATPGEPDEIP
ncbi:MAG: HupE/UreJ family protein [Pseudomonadota bacterium]